MVVGPFGVPDWSVRPGIVVTFTLEFANRAETLLRNSVAFPMMSVWSA